MENNDLHANGGESQKMNSLESEKDSRTLLNNIESDDDTLEPIYLDHQDGTISTNDPAELEYWADELQVSTGELEAVVLLAGEKLSDIRKYLSV